MKINIHIAITLLSLITFMPSSVFCVNPKPKKNVEAKRSTQRNRNDSIILSRLFSYQRNFIGSSVDSIRKIYLKSNIYTLKRNPMLMLVPSMYEVSRGNRNYIGETFGTLKFRSFNDFHYEEKVGISTVPHSRKILPHLIYYIMPNLYGECLFNNSLISPFNKANRSMYKYNVTASNFGRAIVYFKPVHANTQLVWGYAMINTNTGKIIRTNIRGEFDMIKFDVRVDMGHEEVQSVFPKKSSIVTTFSLLGNKISSQLSARFDDLAPLPDSIGNARTLIDSIRPRPLSKQEEQIYKDFFKEKEPQNDSTVSQPSKKREKIYNVAWDVIGDYLIGSMKAKTDKASIKMSPLVNPLYLSYSGRKGLSYRMKIGAHYSFNENSDIALTPQFGYNFKIKRFFVNAPLKYTYDKKHDAWLELRLQNGNVITNSEVLNKIKGENRDTIDFSSLNLDYFKDYNLSFFANRDFNKYIGLQIGINYHVREALNKEAMRLSGNPTAYRSFAPSLVLTLTPLRHGPIFTLNYERSLKSVLRSNTKYERIEIDGVYNKKLQRLRQYNIRLGGGLYTHKSSQYFVDFENFHENYLPGGWNDDWTGDFQLLNSEWYNASKYYVRANFSYESPLLVLSWLPWIGNFVETERLYYSILNIENTRPYYELGYGFSTRFVSVGIFASFLTGQFHELGTKFTFELFRKW